MNRSTFLPQTAGATSFAVGRGTPVHNQATSWGMTT
jgi:hypothetical protein